MYFDWFTGFLGDFLYFLPLDIQLWFGIVFGAMVVLVLWRILV